MLKLYVYVIYFIGELILKTIMEYLPLIEVDSELFGAS